ncbi:endonuclease/exonuclease/phosphatase family protein [Streptomyces sp. NPDC026673]|uniref:endonuclease/exonuclease/phosphatase family protein n=1 Tax=Streptomyces sp. NPDC026673 TaxID=3155724 RepID=UPI0033CA9E01
MPGRPPGTLARESTTLRVVGWNIREGVPLHDPGRPVAEALAADMAGFRPDVLALQEVAFTEGDRSPLLEEVSRTLGLPHRLTFPYSPAMHLPGARAGLALLARQPWRAEARALLPNPGLRQPTPRGEIVSWDKGVLFGRLRHGASEVWVGNVHLHPFHLFGAAAEDPVADGVWKGLAEFVRALPEGPLLLCADLNTERRDLLLDRLPDRRLTSAITAGTSRIGMAVDDVLLGAGLDLRRSSVRYGFSDHALCMVELEVAP